MMGLIYSVGATAIFNMVIQFLLYPSLERTLGSNQYGIILSIISLLAITAGAAGYSISCSRLLGVSNGYTQNGDYNIILLILGTIGTLIGIAYIFYLDMASPVTLMLWLVLSFFTLIRNYSEVEFRLKTNFFRYLIFYVLISLGYIIGLLLFRISKQWMVSLIIGELFGFIYVCCCGSIYRKPFFTRTANFQAVFSSITFILISALIDNITLNADRILLLTITKDGTAVTTYYIASLVGKLIALFTGPINTLIISYLVRYNGKLSKKTWGIIILIALFCGTIAFVAAMIVSPWIIGFLYPDNLNEVKPYFIPAILGQILFFVSGVLMAILLRFKGEKKQFLFNGFYAIEFFICVICGTIFGGLSGFVWSIFIANTLRFVSAIIWGMFDKKSAA